MYLISNILLFNTTIFYLPNKKINKIANVSAII